MSYAHPHVLTNVEWLKQNLDKPGLAVVEVDYDPKLAYEQGHIPGALLIDWRIDMNKHDSRDIIDAKEFEALMSKLGISNETHVVLYGTTTTGSQPSHFGCSKCTATARCSSSTEDVRNGSTPAENSRRRRRDPSRQPTRLRR